MTPQLYQSCDNDSDGVQHFCSLESSMLLPVNPVITSFQGFVANCEASLQMLSHDAPAPSVFCDASGITVDFATDEVD
jgi:hypothetical protein